MSRGRPVEPETRAEAARLIEAGMTRNAIARKLGIGAATVTQIAADVGLSFDRAQTDAATKARAVDLAAERISLAEKMAEAAHELLDSRNSAYTVYNFGGKDNTYEEHTLEQPPVEVKRSIVVTAGIAFDKLTRIVEKSDSGLDQAVGVLDTIAEGFAAAAEKYRESTTDEA